MLSPSLSLSKSTDVRVLSPAQALSAALLLTVAGAAAQPGCDATYQTGPAGLVIIASSGRNAEQPDSACAVCLTNGGFENPTTCNPSTWGTPPWTVCGSGTPTPDTQPCGSAGWPTTSVSAYEGSNFIGVAGGGNIMNVWEGVSQPICETLKTGVQYTVSIALQVHDNSNWGNTDAVFELRCKTGAGCNNDNRDLVSTLLWSQSVTNDGTWQVFTGTFTPTGDCVELLLTSNVLGGWSGGKKTYLLIDALEITKPCGTPPAVSVAAAPATLCAGNCTDISATATGGTPPYAFAWDNGIAGTTAGPHNVCPSATTTYRVTLTDNNGDTATASATVTVDNDCNPCGGNQVAAPCFSNPSFEAPKVMCDCTTGAAPCNSMCIVCINNSCSNCPCSGQMVYPPHRTPPSWTECLAGYTPDTQPGNWGVTNPPSDGNSYLGLTRTTGAWQEGASQQLCAPLVTGTAYQFSVDLAKSTISSNGSCPKLEIWGGYGDCAQTELLWDSGPVNNTAWQAYTVSFTPAAPYTHILFIINQGCTPGQPYLLVDNIVTDTSSSLTVGAIKTDAACSGDCSGSGTANASGGTSPYSYLWSDASSQTTASVSGLCPGAYTVTVTDGGGCSDTAIVTITGPAPLAATETKTDIACNGACSGSGALSVSGGTPGYSYLWSDGSTSLTASGLCPGAYSVTATDAAGCTTTKSIIISEPPAIMLDTATTNSTCTAANGSATVTASGGTPGYTYLWSSGQSTATATGLGVGSYTVTVTDAAGCVKTATAYVTASGGFNVTASGTDALCAGACNGTATANPTGGTAPFSYQWSDGSSQTTAMATGLCAGSYGVIVTDANGCSGPWTVNIGQPAALSLTETHSNVTCSGGNDGSVNITASGGTAPYSYLWNNGSTAEDLFNLTTYNLQLTVTDANNCTSVISVVITEPSQLILFVSQTSSGCGLADGTATVTITGGGQPPFTYRWSDAGSQTTPMATGLPAGTYTVTVTDNNGCTAAATATITDQGAPAASITASVNAGCAGWCDGSATASASGGTAPYTFLWNDGSTSPTATGLCAGTYPVTITDAAGCKAVTAAAISEPTAMSADTAIVHVPCYGDSTGSANVTVSGGAGPYTYLWSNGATSEDLINIPAGSYTLSVTDANTCTLLIPVTVVQPNALTLSPTTIQPTSCGMANGMAAVQASGGTPSYSYLWSNGATSPTAAGLDSGLYSVTVTDAAGCTSTSSVNIGGSDIPTVCFTGPATGCVPVTASFTNCSSSGSCLWDFGDGSTSGACNPTHTFTAPGCYNVSLTVTDPAGCSNTAVQSCLVEGYAGPSAGFDMNPTLLSILDPTVDFTDKSTNASGWFWNFGDNTMDSLSPNPTHTYADTGCYDVTLTLISPNGCTDEATRTICVKDIATLYIPNAFSPNKDGINDYFTIRYYNLCELELWIFDRWGNEIYQTTSIQGWDGTVGTGTDIVQEDVYVWMINAVDCNGKETRRTGHVSVVK